MVVLLHAVAAVATAAAAVVDRLKPNKLIALGESGPRHNELLLEPRGD